MSNSWWERITLPYTLYGNALRGDVEERRLRRDVTKGAWTSLWWWQIIRLWGNYGFRLMLKVPFLLNLSLCNHPSPIILCMQGRWGLSWYWVQGGVHSAQSHALTFTHLRTIRSHRFTWFACLWTVGGEPMQTRGEHENSLSSYS